MPTDTPSPHRFLAPHVTATQPTKPKPQSGLRHVQAIQTPSAARQTPNAYLNKVTPARRFVIPPPRAAPTVETAVGARERPQETWTDAPTQETPRPKPRRKFERVESIQDSSQSSTVGTQEEHNGDSTEQANLLFHDAQQAANDASEETEMLFVPLNHRKRRRVSPPSSPSTRPATAPHTPLPTHTPPSHRFKVPPPRTPAPFPSIANIFAATPLPKNHPTPPPQRPHFILPPQPPSPPKPSNPLPEIFSPSRKHGKYVPDGLAATMTSWIFEAANTGFAAQERGGSGAVVWGRERDDGVKLRVRVGDVATGSGLNGLSEGEGGGGVECFAGGVVFVKGEGVRERYHASRAGSIGADDGQVRVLLAGQGGARGWGGVRVERGGVVGVRAPMWEVAVGGEMWMVGVDWVVL